MEIIELTSGIVEEYIPFISRDMVENLSRKYFSGAIVIDDDDEPVSAIIWEVKHSDDEAKNSEVELAYLKINDEEAGDELLSSYVGMADESYIDKTVFDLPHSSLVEYEELLKKNGFDIIEGESNDLYVTVGDIFNLDFIKKKEPPSYIYSLGTLDSRSFKRGIIECIYNSKREVLEDLSNLPIDWYEQDVSCYEEADGSIKGFLLVHRLPSGGLRIELLSDWGPDGQKMLLHMVRFSALRVKELYSPETPVVIHRHDAASTNLATYMFPQVKGAKSIKGERKRGE
ncbi:MAG: hypothetical protein K6F99_06860 [Lachnospiraceae bacterium]|nr:hypothetical protein [Lachnospiraceae bacterium]